MYSVIYASLKTSLRENENPLRKQFRKTLVKNRSHQKRNRDIRVTGTESGKVSLFTFMEPGEEQLLIKHVQPLPMA